MSFKILSGALEALLFSGAKPFMQIQKRAAWDDDDDLELNDATNLLGHKCHQG